MAYTFRQLLTEKARVTSEIAREIIDLTFVEKVKKASCDLPSEGWFTVDKDGFISTCPSTILMPLKTAGLCF